MRELTVNGNYFDVGYQIGVFGKKEIGYILRKKKDGLAKTLKNTRLLKKAITEAEKEAPDLLAELQGIATGAEAFFEKIFALNYPEIIGTYGCTTVLIKNRKDFFVAHNEDDEDWLRPEDYTLINYHLNNGLKYSAFVMLGNLPGSTFAWNGAGLFFAVDTLVASQPAQPPRLSRYFQNNLIIESPSLDDVVKNANKIKSASNDHVLVVDVNSQLAMSIEKSGGQASVKKLHSLYIHTNHHLHSRFKSEYTGQEFFGTSKERLAIAHEIFSAKDNQKSVLKKLTTQLKRPLYKDDRNKTWATALCDVSDKQVMIYLPGEKVVKKMGPSF